MQSVTVGELLQIYLDRIPLTQAQLAEAASCSPAMVNRIIKGRKIPGKALAHKIAAIVAHEEHQEAMYFYLRGMHQDFERIVKECPDAFEDFAEARKQDEGMKIV